MYTHELASQSTLVSAAHYTRTQPRQSRESDDNLQIGRDVALDTATLCTAPPRFVREAELEAEGVRTVVA